MPWLLASAVVSAAGSAYSANQAGGKGGGILQLPEYPESEGARQEWWNMLQQWGQDPNYGAISPDWDSIWENVQSQVKQYYEGGPLTTGIRDKLKANLARRNMSESPASDYLMMASGAEEANQMKDISVTQAAQKAALAESGRNTWLNSLMQLSGQKPSFASRENIIGGNSNQTSQSNLIGSGMDAIGNLTSNQDFQNWFSGLFSPQNVSNPYTFNNVNTYSSPTNLNGLTYAG